VNSGILPGEGGGNFSLTFTKAGSYGYVCLLHPGMAGTVVVQPAGSAYPMTQAQVDDQANSELYARLASANQQLQSARLTSQPNPNGTTTYTVVNGIGGNQASVLRFLPVGVTIRAGDSVSFPVQDPHEIHTVTFYDPSGPVPAFLEPQPQPAGPPRLFVRNVTPEGGTVVDRQGLFNSGILAPGQSYTFTFPKPGVYTYVCMLHAAEGMFGTITVQAAGQPATLPVTGAGTTAPSLLLLVAGALVLLALGAWIARRRLSRPAGGL
jgi:plastocyanin